jgi:acetolactate synthase regulatory subunit
MHTATPVSAALPSRATRTPRLVALDVRNTPDVLNRVLTLLLRRRCRVTRVEFVAASAHRPGSLVLGFDAPAAHADRAAVWLSALIDVVSVEPLDSR